MSSCANRTHHWWCAGVHTRTVPYLVGRGNVLADQTAGEPGRSKYDYIVQSVFPRVRRPAHGAITMQTSDEIRWGNKNLADIRYLATRAGDLPAQTSAMTHRATAGFTNYDLYGLTTSANRRACIQTVPNIMGRLLMILRFVSGSSQLNGRIIRQHIYVRSNERNVPTYVRTSNHTHAMPCNNINRYIPT